MQSRETSGSIFDQARDGRNKDKQGTPLEISSALGKTLGLVDGMRVSPNTLEAVR